MLIDLTEKKITGKAAEEVLQSVGIILNRSTIPFETAPPFITSGVRIGTPPVTTRGMRESEMELIADYISETIDNRESETLLKRVKKEVKDLTSRFPVFYGE